MVLDCLGHLLRELRKIVVPPLDRVVDGRHGARSDDVARQAEQCEHLGNTHRTTHGTTMGLQPACLDLACGHYIQDYYGIRHAVA